MLKMRNRKSLKRQLAPATSRPKGRPSSREHQVGAQKVLDTARVLLKRSRPSRLSRAEVAREAGIDEKLVRYYFEKHDDLLDAVTDLSIQDLDQTMERASRTRGSASETMRQRINGLLEFLADNPTFFKLLVERVYERRNRQAPEKLRGLTEKAYGRLAKVVEDGRRSGEFRDDFDPRHLYIAIIGMAEFFITGRPVVELLFSDNGGTLKRYEEFVFSLIMYGIRGWDHPR